MGSPSNKNTPDKQPAWKILREQRRRNIAAAAAAPPISLYNNSNSNNDELGGTRRYSPRSSIRKYNTAKNSLDGTAKTAEDTDSLLSNDNSSYHSRVSLHSNASQHTSRSIHRRVRNAALDPNLPSAFRDSLQRRPVTSTPNTNFRRNRDTFSTTSTFCSDISLGSLSLDDSSDDESLDSFASLGSDDDQEDEAYQQSRNRMAQEEQQQLRQERSPTPRNRSRFRTNNMGVHGIPLFIIAE